MPRQIIKRHVQEYTNYIPLPLGFSNQNMHITIAIIMYNNVLHIPFATHQTSTNANLHNWKVYSWDHKLFIVVVLLEEARRRVVNSMAA